MPFPSIQQFSSPRRPGKIKPLSAPPYVRLDYYFRLPLAKCTCARALYSKVKPAWRSSRRTRLPPAGGGPHSHGTCLVRLLTWKHRASFASLMLRVPVPLIKPLGHRYFLPFFLFFFFIFQTVEHAKRYFSRWRSTLNFSLRRHYMTKNNCCSGFSSHDVFWTLKLSIERQREKAA